MKSENCCNNVFHIEVSGYCWRKVQTCLVSSHMASKVIQGASRGSVL